MYVNVSAYSDVTLQALLIARMCDSQRERPQIAEKEFGDRGVTNRVKLMKSWRNKFHCVGDLQSIGDL